MKLLIVDDEPFNVALLEKMLKRAGFNNYVSTTDSRETLGICQASEPDLILLDLRMPHLNGFDVMGNLHADERLRDIPVLVLTAENSKENRLQALQAGAKDFISKPFDRTEVLTRIRNILETKRLQNHLLAQNHDLDQIVQERTKELSIKQKHLEDLNNRLEERVTERTADLQEANNELEQVNHTMSELVSIVSHELRTPLTSIKSFAEILRDEADNLEKPDKDKFLTIIDKESDRLTRLISDLLDLQKIHSGKMVWKSELLELDQILKDTVEFFTPSFKNKSLALSYNSEIETANTLADADKFRQVISNLFSNALKFTQRGGVDVCLSLSTQWADSVLLSKDQNTADTLKAVLSELNVQLRHFTAGEDAFRYLNTNGGNVDMLFIDLSTSEGSSVNDLELLRGHFPSLPIATITETGSEKTANQPCMSAIKKPLDPYDANGSIALMVNNLMGINPKTKMLHVSVTDTGSGIPAEELNKVFAQFHQVDCSQIREQRGTGLGLAICKEIIEHYGGKIWVESELERGSTFHILIPEFRENKKKLGEILIEKGIVTEEQLSQALSDQA
jgi:signal transduction histidine kinase